MLSLGRGGGPGWWSRSLFSVVMRGSVLVFVRNGRCRSLSQREVGRRVAGIPGGFLSADGRCWAVPEPIPRGHSTLVAATNLRHIPGRATKTIDLETDALERLESAKWTLEESYSDVVRRAHFPQKPHLARELLEEFQQRAGRSPLTEEALDRLTDAQRHPARSPSHWD